MPHRKRKFREKTPMSVLKMNQVRTVLHLQSTLISKSHGSEKSEDDKRSSDTVLGCEKVTKRRTSTKAYDQNHLGDKTRKKAGGGQNNKNQPKASYQSKEKIENKEKVGVVKAGTIHTFSGAKNVSNVPTIFHEKRAHFRGGAYGSKVEQGDEKVCRLYGENGYLSPHTFHFPPLSSNLFQPSPTKGGAEHKGSKMKEECG
ncbi:hypothetical protein U1Q18_040771 [Sarracenia purpurea var. burkii]